MLSTYWLLDNWKTDCTTWPWSLLCVHLTFLEGTWTQFPGNLELKILKYQYCISGLVCVGLQADLSSCSIPKITWIQSLSVGQKALFHWCVCIFVQLKLCKKVYIFFITYMGERSISFLCLVISWHWNTHSTSMDHPLPPKKKNKHTNKTQTHNKNKKTNKNKTTKQNTLPMVGCWCIKC